MIIKCKNCNKDVIKKPSEVKRTKNIFCNHKCQGEYSSKRIPCQCAYCGESITKTLSSINRSRSGNMFCDRSCATSFNNTKYKTGELHPNYTSGYGSYRSRAIKHYGEHCSKCNYDKIIHILQVHHIDNDRQNNKIENLQVLCPNCHAEIHWGPKGTQRKK